VGVLELAPRRVLQEHGDEEVSALGTVALVRLEQPVAAGEPAERRPELAPEQHAVTHPEGAANGGPDLARGQMSAVCPLEPGDVVRVQAKHVGGSREQLEVVGRERQVLVGRSESLVGVAPRPARVGGAGPLELTLCIHGHAIVDPVATTV